MPTTATPAVRNGRRRGGHGPALVVDVSLGDPAGDYDFQDVFLDREVRVLRVGTGGRVDEALALIDKWAEQAQAIAVTGLHEARVSGRHHGDLAALESAPRTLHGASVTRGTTLREVLQEWAVRHLGSEFPGYFTNARVVVLGGPHQSVAARVLRESTANITSADPALLDMLGRLEPVPLVGRVAAMGLAPARRLPGRVQSLLWAPGPVRHAYVRRAATECDVVVATFDELMGLALEDLHGKTVIGESISPGQLAELTRRDVDMVLDTTPQPFDVTVDVAVLEALMLVASPNVDELHVDAQLTADDLLRETVAAGLEPRVLQPNGPRRKSRFAFVIHPLSQRYLAQVEPLRTVSEFAPGVVMDAVEKAAAYLPPFVYSHVTGIRSPTGAEAEGWLITVGGTPGQLLAHRPEFTYSKLLEAAEIARQLGAQIIGLGAFTKVVGDAGVTAARQAPLPVTTGNSYSASATLWAAREALLRLGLVDVDDAGVIRGKAMIIGATGSIGSACARILALASEEVWLISPESAKLLALKAAIERDTPRAKVRIAATPGEHLREMDLIVTATSAAGARVLDIMAVKPGCVITDVARPLDLSAEDVARRPDVLVVESGEIELPGELHMRDVGLPPGVAYACLAETVVLALEGRYECFTVGRDIEWAKVKQIYQLGLKHGMKLATISGIDGPFTDAAIGAVREHALAARAETAAASL